MISETPKDVRQPQRALPFVKRFGVFWAAAKLFASMSADCAAKVPRFEPFEAICNNGVS